MKQLNIKELWRILVYFDGGISEFEDYLGRADNSSGRQLSRLWQHLLGCMDDYTDNQADRALAFNAIYGQKADYNGRKFQATFRLLQEQLEKFIHSLIITSTDLGQFLLSDTYRKNGFPQLRKDSLEDALEKTKHDKSVISQFIRWVVYRDQFYLGDEKATKVNGNFQKSDQELDEFYLENKLRNIIDELSAFRIYQKEITTAYHEKIELILALIPPKTTALVEVQVQAIAYYLNPNRDGYEAFKSSYFSKVDHLEMGKSFLLISLVNALTLFPNPDEKLREEYLILYKFGFENDLLTEDGQISSFRFDNIVFCAEFLGDFEFIRKLINKLRDLIIGKKEKKRSLLLTESYALFGEGKYELAITNLKILEKAKDVPYAFFLRKHLLKLKCYYEQAEYRIDAYVNIKNEESSFRRMLARYTGKYIDQSVKRCYLNFFNLLSKMANERKPKNNKEYLMKILLTYKEEVVELKWLKEKLEELA